MKHRGSSKIKYQHDMIKGLRKFLEEIEPWEEIKTLIPGEIRPTKSVRKFVLAVQYETQTGLKCLAKSGNAVQEVFVVTNNPEGFKKRLASYATIYTSGA